ncbi:MAG: aspartate aminotransferase [Candidatus Entotheonella gemina]|uniref:Aspartate aminotransferase n=1 Tax=Candidatus Entotheonella gemina TaxID=1429439 RepID=W4MFD6_9BACT|nr:MAG: aspartate aminotransferase [Candidatus Entotheonella gemina]
MLIMSIAQGVRQHMQASAWIRGMFEEGIRLKQQYGADNVYDFSLGNPVQEPPPQFHEALRHVVEQPRPGMHRYMPNTGYPETRAAIANQLNQETGLAWHENHIVMVVGAAGGLNVILKTLLDPGDEVIIFAPYFVEYLFYVENHQGASKVVRTDEQFNPDLDALAQALSPRTKAVLINAPNNPSGVIYPAETIAALGELLRQKQAAFGTEIYLVSDEPYKKLLYDDAVYPDIYAHYANSLVVTSHAKDLALPGERIGYIAINPGCANMQDLQDGLSFTNRTLGFVNAPALMQHVITYLQGVTIDMSDYQRKRALLCDHLAAMGYQFVRPQGAFYLFPKAPIDDDVAFVKALQDERILTVPGSGFGTPGYFRISYCVEDETIERSLDGFRKVAHAYGLS